MAVQTNWKKNDYELQFMGKGSYGYQVPTQKSQTQNNCRQRLRAVMERRWIATNHL